MKKNRTKSARTKHAKVFVSRKKIDKALIMGVLATDQTTGCCIIDTGNGRPHHYSTTAQGCAMLGRQFGVEPNFLPGETCRTD